MVNLLAIAVWPAGLVAILAAGALLAWRAAAPGARQGSLPRFLTGGGNRGVIPARTQVTQWLALMKYATQVGYKWTAWGAAITGAVRLTFSWRRNRWIPAVAIISLIFTEHFATIALNLTFHRPVAVHWFTDVLSGMLWGCLLGLTSILIVRLTAGPVGAPEDAALPPRDTAWQQAGSQVPA
jgi:hypothetical protein